AVEISKSQESEDLIPDSATIAGSSGATENNQTPSHRDATSNQSKVVALKEPTDQEISRIDVSGYGSSVISVETESGAWLYDICLEDGSIPSQIRLSDGELIQRACGSNRFVLSIPSGPGAFEYFILDWLVICPGTFNIYIATHEGGYNAFFLNNGWQIHQYQIADEQLNLVSEPATPGVTSRRTYQVVNLEIDLSGGTMAFQNPTNGATITLESRRL
ncbi:MAG: hypothetical protein K8F91_14785, partial [Candidatus Obscuribacterales bacterium]|nr:hypothetical protein [Candidatus Obscuribacterales bacterium]